MHKAVFLDRDGVINKLERGQYVTEWGKFKFLAGVFEGIKKLNDAGYLVIVITNQSAINRGFMTKEQLKEVHSKMLGEVKKSGGKIDAVYFCPHRPDELCECRKPNTGLFARVNKDFKIDYSGSWFIGDFESDRAVAEKMGLKFILANGDDGLMRAVEDEILR